MLPGASRRCGRSRSSAWPRRTPIRRAQLQHEIDERAAALGVRARLVEREGDPATEIAKVADELRVDAVIVGASTQVGHRFIGALGVHLVRLAHWPVTVVP